VSSSFAVYIDESGDEGFAFGQGSSEWFVLSAVITRKAFDLETVKLVDLVRQQLGKPPKKPLHFRDLKHEQRLLYVRRIAESRLRALAVLAHKPSLTEQETFRQRYLLYRYASRYLLERVSWYCRDHRSRQDRGDGTAEIIFSNRASMSYQELRDYLDLLRSMTAMDVRIEWSVIDPERVVALTSGKRMGLQIADAVAGSLYYAVERTRYGFTEDRYAKMLKPVLYHHRGKFLGYGLKFWPRECESLIQSDERLEWVRAHYKK